MLRDIRYMFLPYCLQNSTILIWRKNYLLWPWKVAIYLTFLVWRIFAWNINSQYWFGVLDCSLVHHYKDKHPGSPSQIIPVFLLQSTPTIEVIPFHSLDERRWFGLAWTLLFSLGFLQAMKSETIKRRYIPINSAHWNMLCSCKIASTLNNARDLLFVLIC